NSKQAKTRSAQRMRASRAFRLSRIRGARAPPARGDPAGIIVSMRLHPVVLCGGSGTRLWPMSRRLLPKQFLALAGSRSLLQETVLRVQALPQVQAPLIISNDEHRFLVAEQLAQLGARPAAHLLE